MTQPTERRFVMEPRLDAEVETLNTAISAEATARANADNLKVNKAGDTMTGALVLPGNPSTNLQAAPKQYVDSTVSTEASARIAADALKVDLTDARLTDQRTPLDNSVTSAKIVDGAIVNADINNAAAIAFSKLALPTADVDINTHKVINVVDPTNAQDAATKAYVDSLVASGATTGPRLVRVKAGVALTKGQPVYITSADGTNMIAGLAGNGSEATSSKTMGLMQSTVANNGFGYIVSEGLLSGLDTSAATAGDPVWLGTTGNLIFGLANKPVAPAHLVFIGIVTKANGSTGEIFIRPQNGFELDELHNVLITSPTNGQALTYETASGLWKNATPVNALSGLSDVAISSPSGGQVVKYNAGTSKWVNGAAAGGVTAADTAPSLSTSSAGDAWFDTNDGTLYVCYVDVDSTKQWVQVQANSALEASILSRVGALESTAIAVGTLSPNYLINGSFDIWQRGTSSTSAGYATADRWYHTATNTTWSQDSTNVVAGAQYSLKATMSGAGQPLVYQAIETLNAVQVAGKTVTLSAYLASNVSVAGLIRVEYSTTVDNALTGTWTTINSSNPTLTSTLTRYSLTVAVPSTAKSIRVLCATNTSLASGNTFTIGQVQLEVGSVATAFRRSGSNVQAELAACQRYYYRTNWPVGGTYGNIGLGAAGGTTQVVIDIPVQTTMRAVPTSMDTYGNASGGFQLDTFGAGSINSSSLTFLSYDNHTTSHMSVQVGATGLTQFRTYRFISVVLGNGLGFSAEL